MVIRSARRCRGPERFRAEIGDCGGEREAAAKGPVKLVVESPVSKGGLTEWKSQTIDLVPAKPKKGSEGRQ